VGKDARNTPQAFSHFSYQYTQGKLMIVDIQGVGDKYTARGRPADGGGGLRTVATFSRQTIQNLVFFSGSKIHSKFLTVNSCLHKILII